MRLPHAWPHLTQRSRAATARIWDRKMYLPRRSAGPVPTCACTREPWVDVVRSATIFHIPHVDAAHAHIGIEPSERHRRYIFYLIFLATVFSLNTHYSPPSYMNLTIDAITGSTTAKFEYPSSSMLSFRAKPPHDHERTSLRFPSNSKVDFKPWW
jgi:hypothetical protein